MRHMMKVLVVLALALGVPAAAMAGGVDYGDYAQVLARYVDARGVDYDGLKADEARLDAALRSLEAVKPQDLEPAERFAFWINVYNAYTLKLILTEYPGIDGIRDIGGIFSGPWSKRFIPVDGRTLTLDEVEKDILIPRFRDARVHFAINCASKSCPPLLAEPFIGQKLEEQLDERATSFINNGRDVVLDGGELRVSSIFKWYDEDFIDVPAYIRRYARGELAVMLMARPGEQKVVFLEYDWSLNRR